MPRDKINSRAKISNPWEVLENAIVCSLQAEGYNSSLSMVMHACNDLISQGKQNEIYECLLKHLKEHFETWHKQLQSEANDPLLTSLSIKFDYLKKYFKIFPAMYTPYDQYFKKEPKKILKSVRRIFIDIILSDEKLFTRSITPIILRKISLAQNGSENVSLTDIKNIIQMYYSFNNDEEKKEIFDDFYEQFIIKQADFNDFFFSSNFHRLSFTEYLTRVQDQFKKNKTVFELLFKPEHVKHVLTLYNKDLLESKQNFFLDGQEPGIAEALTSVNLLPMKYLVDTYTDFELDMQNLYVTCANYIMNEMLKFAQEIPQDSQIVDPRIIGNLIKKTIELTDPYLKIFTSKEAITELNNKIRLAWNDERFNVKFSFVDYIDSLLISGFRNEKFDEQINIIPRFYSYIIDKFSFNKNYETVFVRRIIRMRRNLDEFELPIIKAIQKMSVSFMPKYDKFKSALLNSELMEKEFKSQLEKNTIEVRPFTIVVQDFPLNSSECNIVPSDLVKLTDDFKKFYEVKNQANVLTLVYQGTLVEIKYNINRHIYNIFCDLLCATVLTNICKQPQTYQSIIESLGNNKDAAKKVVKRLEKIKLISRQPRDGERKNTDVFSLNSNFSFRSPAVNIPPIFSQDWRSNNVKYNEIEHNLAVKMACMRELKQHIRMTRDELTMIVTERLHQSFQVTPEMVRRAENTLLTENSIRSETNGPVTTLTYIH